MRIGHGYDTHRFCEDAPLILGGVTIPFKYGLLAHSDGDVVIHATCDALLGAAGLGDIGSYFPDTDDKFENIDSRVLLRDIVSKLDAVSHSIVNVDVTIIAEVPKMAPHLQEMISNIASDLRIDASGVNIKATTSEKMGFIGREEGIAVHAVALID